MSVAAQSKYSRRTARPALQTIPSGLIYEMWQEKPIYYKGYRDVLAGKKTIEEVMRSAAQSCSNLQGVLISLLNYSLGNTIDRKKYLLATNEIGIHLALNDNLGNDVVIFEKEKIGKLKGKYFDNYHQYAAGLRYRQERPDLAHHRLVGDNPGRRRLRIEHQATARRRRN